MNDNDILLSMIEDKRGKELARINALCNVDVMYDSIVNVLTNRIDNNKEPVLSHIRIDDFIDIDEDNTVYLELNNRVITELAEKLKKNGFKANIRYYTDEYCLDVSVKEPSFFTKLILKLKGGFHNG